MRMSLMIYFRPSFLEFVALAVLARDSNLKNSIHLELIMIKITRYDE